MQCCMVTPQLMKQGADGVRPAWRGYPSPCLLSHRLWQLNAAVCGIGDLRNSHGLVWPPRGVVRREPALPLYSRVFLPLSN